MTGHEYWEEQAAGYALDALEPDETDEFLRHLDGCDECRRLVDEHSLIAAQLGALAYDDRPAPTWSHVRAGIVGATQEPTPAADTVIPLRRRRRVAVALTAVAAAAAAVIGITVWQTSSTSHGPLTSASACAGTAGCHVVELRAGGRTAGSVLVYGDTAAVVSMQSPPPGSEWALWQLPHTGYGPKLLTVFANGHSTHALLHMAYADTAGFAVSREPAGSTPVSPSIVVASGPVS